MNRSLVKGESGSLETVVKSSILEISSMDPSFRQSFFPLKIVDTGLIFADIPLISSRGETG